MLILRFAMDQSLGVYHGNMMIINMTLGVNNLVENTKVTLLEQGLAIVSLDALAMMIPNGIGVIVALGLGTTHN